MLIASLHTALPGSAPGVAPEWVHLIPAGTFSGRDGRGPYHLRDPQAVIRASMAQAHVDGQLPIDENHATDFAATTGQESPARGWIAELQSREDGIWGRVEWTPVGQQLMAERAYRGFSPVFQHDKAGNVRAILRAALTNMPNLPALRTLHTQGTNMDLVTQLRAALGLPETADEATILTTVTANAASVTTHAQQLTQIATVVGVAQPGAATPDGIVTALQTRLATSVSAETVTTLQTQLNEMRATTAKEKAVAFVDSAIKAGKPINALRDHYIARHTQDAASVETEINGMVSINAGGIVQHARKPSGEPDGDELTEVEKQTCQRMGIDPKKFAEHKKTRAANEGSAT
jgi:phage I-like protein